MGLLRRIAMALVWYLRSIVVSRALCIPWTHGKIQKMKMAFIQNFEANVNESGTQRFKGLPAKFTLIQDDPAKTSSGTQRDSRS